MLIFSSQTKTQTKSGIPYFYHPFTKDFKDFYGQERREKTV